MGKTSKKRNKKYSGANAKSDNLLRVHKVNAVVRSDKAQWLHDHRKLIKRVAVAALIVAVVVFLIVQAFIAIG